MKSLYIFLPLLISGFALAQGLQVQSESMAEAESYKFEKPVKEQDAKRSVAGGKFKKGQKAEESGEAKTEEFSSDPDSEVQYWKYSEE